MLITVCRLYDSYADANRNILMLEAAGLPPSETSVISNKHTGNVEEACFFGLSAEFKSDYIRHYAALDPYSPLLDGSWKKLSECRPEPLLRKSEWYNDFVLACGVRDILGARVVETPNHHAIFGLHQQIGRDVSDRLDSTLDLISVSLKHAAWRHIGRLFQELIGCTNPWAAFWLKEAGSISTSTMAAGTRTKPDPFF